jgi:thiamine-monophosphate kinase
MMDISDGIASDIKHIMEPSNVGATIELSHIPTDYDIRYATTGGEDYELLLTVEAAKFEAVARALMEATGTTLTAIGTITAEKELTWLDNGMPTDMEIRGFEHF